jgi:hypothetical protein
MHLRIYTDAVREISQAVSNGWICPVTWCTIVQTSLETRPYIFSRLHMRTRKGGRGKGRKIRSGRIRQVFVAQCYLPTTSCRDQSNCRQAWLCNNEFNLQSVSWAFERKRVINFWDVLWGHTESWRIQPDRIFDGLVHKTKVYSCIIYGGSEYIFLNGRMNGELEIICAYWNHSNYSSQYVCSEGCVSVSLPLMTGYRRLSKSGLEGTTPPNWNLVRQLGSTPIASFVQLWKSMCIAF